MIKCKGCGMDFIKRRGDQKNCSRKCTKRINSRKHYLKNKEIYIENAREWDKKNPEKSRELKKRNSIRWKLENRERSNELMRGYYHRHKDKWRARNKAFKKIPIPKGTLCQECVKSRAVERHHEDYSKPLEVQLLCKRCHLKIPR